MGYVPRKHVRTLLPELIHARDPEYSAALWQAVGNSPTGLLTLRAYIVVALLWSPLSGGLLRLHQLCLTPPDKLYDLLRDPDATRHVVRALGLGAAMTFAGLAVGLSAVSLARSLELVEWLMRAPLCGAPVVFAVGLLGGAGTSLRFAFLGLFAALFCVIRRLSREPGTAWQHGCAAGGWAGNNWTPVTQFFCVGILYPRLRGRRVEEALRALGSPVLADIADRAYGMASTGRVDESLAALRSSAWEERVAAAISLREVAIHNRQMWGTSNGSVLCANHLPH